MEVKPYWDLIHFTKKYIFCSLSLEHIFEYLIIALFLIKLEIFIKIRNRGTRAIDFQEIPRVLFFRRN